MQCMLQQLKPISCMLKMQSKNHLCKPGTISSGFTGFKFTQNLLQLKCNKTCIELLQTIIAVNEPLECTRLPTFIKCLFLINTLSYSPINSNRSTKNLLCVRFFDGPGSFKYIRKLHKTKTSIVFSFSI